MNLIRNFRIFINLYTHSILQLWNKIEEIYFQKGHSRLCLYYEFHNKYRCLNQMNILHFSSNHELALSQNVNDSNNVNIILF